MSHDVQRGHAPDAGAALRETALAGARARLRLYPPGYLRSHPNLALRVVSDAAVISGAVLVGGEPLYGVLEEAGPLPRRSCRPPRR